jgi:hypothetical protein
VYLCISRLIKVINYYVQFVRNKHKLPHRYHTLTFHTKIIPRVLHIHDKHCGNYAIPHAEFWWLIITLTGKLQIVLQFTAMWESIQWPGYGVNDRDLLWITVGVFFVISSVNHPRSYRERTVVRMFADILPDSRSSPQHNSQDRDCRLL